MENNRDKIITNEIVSFFKIMGVNNSQDVYDKLKPDVMLIDEDLVKYSETFNVKLIKKTKKQKKAISWIKDEDIVKANRSIMANKDKQHSNAIRNIVIEKEFFNYKVINKIEKLKADFPNFIEVINYYKGFLNLSNSRSKDDYKAPRPILLIGEPGLGKTKFTKELAKTLKVDFKFLDSNSISTPGVLVGEHASFKGADAGFIFNTVSTSKNISPIILLDEIDKLTNKSNSSFSTFHQILEPENSSLLYDEFLDIPFNASYIIYVLTANDLKSIPESLLSRMNIFEIEKPKKEDMKRISQNIYNELLSNSKLFTKELNEDALEVLSDYSPREVFNMLSNSIYNQASNIDGKNNILKIEIKNKEKNIVGF